MSGANLLSVVLFGGTFALVATVLVLRNSLREPPKPGPWKAYPEGPPTPKPEPKSNTPDSMGF
jgi:hypothetical protein